MVQNFNYYEGDSSHAERFLSLFDRVGRARESFFSRQTHIDSLDSSKINYTCEIFETKRVEHYIGDYFNEAIEIDKKSFFWVAHPESPIDEPLANDATSDTFFNLEENKLIRYESTQAEGTEQYEIKYSYGINSQGNLEKTIDIDREFEEDPLIKLTHPALRENVEIEYVGVVNETSTEPYCIDSSEIPIDEANKLISFLEYVVHRLELDYQHPEWHLLTDTTSTPHMAGEYGAGYVIERINDY